MFLMFPAMEECIAGSDKYREEMQQRMSEELENRRRQMQKALGGKTLDEWGQESVRQMEAMKELKYEDSFVSEDPLSQLYQRPLSIDLPYLRVHKPETFGAHLEKLEQLRDKYRAQGDLSRLEAEFQRVVTATELTLGTEHPEVAAALTNLARVYVTKRDYSRAEPLLQRALLIVENALGTEHSNYASALYNLAELFRARGHYGQAEDFYERALTVAEKAYQDPEHPTVAAALNNLGVIHATKGDPDRAISLYERARTIYTQALDKVKLVNFGMERNLAVTLSNEGLAAWQQGDLARAVPWLTRAHEIHDRTIWVTFNSLTETQQRIVLGHLTSGTDALLSLHQISAPDNPSAASLAFTVLLQRKGRSLDAMTEAMTALHRLLLERDYAPSGIPSQGLAPLRALLNDLRSVQAQLAHLWLKGPRAKEDRQYEAQRADLERQERVLRATIAERAESERTREYLAKVEWLEAEEKLDKIAEFLQRGGQPDLLGQVQKALPAEMALVEFVRYRPFNPMARHPKEQWRTERYSAYVLHSHGAPAVVELGDAPAIDESIERFRRSLSEPGSSSVPKAGRQLDEQVMRPVRALLGNTRAVLLAPDSALHLVPFGALRDEEDRYLIERFHFTYLTSGSDLLRLQEHGQHRQGAVIIANPDFGTAAGGSGIFHSLPGTAAEAKALQALLSETQVLEGSRATEAALKSMQGPRILHLATHGFFLPGLKPGDRRLIGRGVKVEGAPGVSESVSAADPGTAPPMIRAGLSLAGANDLESDKEDGILTALEVTGLDLWGTQLVVLSACETGIGDVQSGEGVYGLRRAFVMAGAESQVVSLWKVDDAATKDLMVDYYRRLLSGAGRSEALRQAQLNMLNSRDRHHAYYWASFIPAGSWTGLEERRGAGDKPGHK